MFKEHKRSSFKDKDNTLTYRFRVGDKITVSGKSGVILEKRSLRQILESLTDVEAKSLLKKLKLKYENVEEYYLAVVQIKDLISTVEPHQMSPDTT
tara:strand:- start:1065 stop:1352 length:288 start_codon:yes stop_codon:yes gene_type:complete